MSQHAEDCFNYILYFLVGEPFFFTQHFLTHQAVFDVGVIDRSAEFESWKLERELFRKVNINDEFETLIRASNRSINA